MCIYPAVGDACGHPLGLRRVPGAAQGPARLRYLLSVPSQGRVLCMFPLLPFVCFLSFLFQPIYDILYIATTRPTK